jgi:hypothetical protein
MRGKPVKKYSQPFWMVSYGVTLRHLWDFVEGSNGLCTFDTKREAMEAYEKLRPEFPKQSKRIVRVDSTTTKIEAQDGP